MTLRIICLVSLVVSLSVGCSKNQNDSPQEPYPAPNFEAKDFRTGRTVRLSDFSGKIVIINFWFAGCPATPLEAPSLSELSKGNNDIVVLGITTPELNDLAEIDSFAKKYGWNFPILLSNGEVEKLFDKELVYPTTFLINQEGYVVGKIVNYTDFQSTEMKDVIDNIRNGKLRWYYRYILRLK